MKMSKYSILALLLTITISCNIDESLKNENDENVYYAIDHNSIYTDMIIKVKADSKGNVWCSNTEAIFKLIDDKWVTFDNFNSLQANFEGINSFALDEDNNVWCVANGNKAFLIENDSLVYFNTDNSLPYSDFIDIVIDDENSKWIAYKNGLIKIDSNEYTLYKNEDINPQLYNLSNWFLFLNNENGIWIYCFRYGLVYWTGNSSKLFTPENSMLPSDVVYDVAFDKDNNAWICSSEGLAMYSKDGSWAMMDSVVLGIHTTSITIDSSNIKWVVARNPHRLYRYDDNNWVIFDNENFTFPDTNFYSIVTDRDNNKWLSTGRGVFKFKHLL